MFGQLFNDVHAIRQDADKQHQCCQEQLVLLNDIKTALAAMLAKLNEVFPPVTGIVAEHNEPT